MTPIKFLAKAAFIAALEERRPFWKAYDEARAKQHLLDEKAWVENERAKMKERMKWSYEDWKKVNRYSSSISLGEFPSCPVLMEAKIDTVLRALQYSYSKSFTVDSNGAWSDAHQLLTWDPNAKTSVC